MQADKDDSLGESVPIQCSPATAFIGRSWRFWGSLSTSAVSTLRLICPLLWESFTIPEIGRKLQLSPSYVREMLELTRVELTAVWNESTAGSSQAEYALLD
jgi:hypothetical protein